MRACINGDGVGKPGIGHNGGPSLDDERSNIIGWILRPSTLLLPLELGGSERTNPSTLGLEEYLDEFTRAVGGSSYKQWSRTGDFKANFQNVLDGTGLISFNLTGIDNVYAAVSRGSMGIGPGAGSVTDWELYMIYSHPTAASRTTWYLNGQVVSNPLPKSKW